MKYMKILVLILFAAQVLTTAVYGQEAKKIAYVSLNKIFEGYHKTKTADAKLEKEGQQKNKERDAMVDKINKLRDEAQLLAKETREKKEIEVNDMMRDLKDFDRDTRLELQRERDEMMKEIFVEMDVVIKDYAKENNYDLIFDERVLIYASDSIDISADISRLLNQKR